MKLLHVGKFYAPFKGGIENALGDLARGQAARGHSVDVLVHQHAPWIASQTETDAGASLTRCRILGSWLYTPLSPTLLATLPWRLAARKPDFVHLHLPNPSGLAALLAPAPPLILHWHADIVASNIDRRLPWLYKLYRPLERLLLHKASAVVVTSQAYLEHSQPLQDFHDKCRVIPLGLDIRRMSPVDPNFTSAIRQRYNDAPLICSLGRLTYYKGFEYLIQAMASLPQAQLVIIGEGDRRPHLEKQIRSLNLDERVHLPGALDDAQSHALLAACDAFCLPSVERTEAFGLSLLEAMHYAKPLVTTRIPGSGVNHVNVHEETGLSVSPADPGALAQALQTLLANQDLRTRYGQAAQQRLNELFTIGQTLDAMDELYEDVGRCPTPRRGE